MPSSPSTSTFHLPPSTSSIFFLDQLLLILLQSSTHTPSTPFPSINHPEYTSWTQQSIPHRTSAWTTSIRDLIRHFLLANIPSSCSLDQVDQAHNATLSFTHLIFATRSSACQQQPHHLTLLEASTCKYHPHHSHPHRHQDLFLLLTQAHGFFLVHQTSLPLRLPHCSSTASAKLISMLSYLFFLLTSIFILILIVLTLTKFIAPNPPSSSFFNTLISTSSSTHTSTHHLIALILANKHRIIDRTKCLALTPSVTRLLAITVIVIKPAQPQALLGLSLSLMMAQDLTLEKPVAVLAQSPEVVALLVLVAKSVLAAKLDKP